MDNPTIFGRILRGEIPSDLLWEDEHCIAFRDISPQAPLHVLVIPRLWINGVATAQDEHASLLGHLLLVAARVARKLGFEESGYRLVINQGSDGQQSVFHLHVHVLAGRQLEWPPG